MDQPDRHRRHRRVRRRDSANAALDVVVVVPARNEEKGLAAGLNSLAAQTKRPDLIVIVVNNSTDGTEKIAYDFADDPDTPPTQVIVLDDNPHKKAGALNAGINYLRQTVASRLEDVAKYLLVMDADTELHPSFIMRAARVMANDTHLGGVSAACRGRHIPPGSPWQRFLLGMQRIEYGRYAYSRILRNVHTMSGAGSFYRTTALQSILDWRGEIFWQNPRNLVEDFETTLALKESGWKVTANQWCVAYTDLMPTLRDLVKQRLRWVRGTVDTLRQRGWTRHTWLSITQIIIGLLAVPLTVYWLYMITTNTWQFGIWQERYSLMFPLFWGMYLAFSARHLGWRSVLIELSLIPELVFHAFRVYWLITSVALSYTTSRRQPAAWSE